MTELSKWQSKLNLKEWSFTTEEILPTQVVYDNDCPNEDRYFRDRNKQRKQDRNYLP